MSSAALTLAEQRSGKCIVSSDNGNLTAKSGEQDNLI